jgi:hypothetical protein
MMHDTPKNALTSCVVRKVRRTNFEVITLDTYVEVLVGEGETLITDTSCSSLTDVPPPLLTQNVLGNCDGKHIRDAENVGNRVLRVIYGVQVNTKRLYIHLRYFLVPSVPRYPSVDLVYCDILPCCLLPETVESGLVWLHASNSMKYNNERPYLKEFHIQGTGSTSNEFLGNRLVWSLALRNVRFDYE